MRRQPVARYLAGACVLFAACALFLLPASAQEPSVQEGPFLDEVVVRVVNVEVFVTRPDGTPVTGLDREDFELRVDGERVEISNFYAETRGRASLAEEAVEPLREGRQDSSFHEIDLDQVAPERRLHLAVYVDHTRLDNSNRRRALNALREVLLHQLAEDDLVTVVSFKNSLVFHSDFLYDRAAVDDILDEVSKTSAQSKENIERRMIINELNRGMSGGFLARQGLDRLEPDVLLARIRAWSQEEYQRALISIRQLEQISASLAGLPGRKAILYVSDGIPNRPGEALYNEFTARTNSDNPGMRGFDFNSNYRQAVGDFALERDMKQLSRRANEAGVTLYALDAEPDHTSDFRSAASEQGAISTTLSIAADNLREPLEQVARATGGRRIQASGLLDEQLASIARDFDTFYSLGFSPKAWEPGKVYDVDVSVQGKNLIVRHREEFGMASEDERAAQATVTSLLYQAVANPFGISLQPGTPAPRDDGKNVLPVLVDIPIRGLTLMPRGETHSVRLVLYVSIKDKRGNPGRVQKIPFGLDIPNDKVEDAMGRSAHYSLPVVLEEGDQQVAVSVLDSPSKVMSSVRLELDAVAAALR